MVNYLSGVEMKFSKCKTLTFLTNNAINVVAKIKTRQKTFAKTFIF